MENTRVKISSIVESQLPLFVREDYPLVTELLTEYYKSLESKGSSYDIVQNIDSYIKVNNLSNLVESCELTSNVSFSDTTISVDNTDGFPKSYGLLLVNSEIILYKSKTSNTFNGCVRGFSGITEYSVGNTEDLNFSTSEISEHSSGDIITNLSSLFLKEFFVKVKKQFAYGFDNRELFDGLNENIFIKQSKDFYSSKGSDRSFEILFRVLYGKDVKVILPRDYLIRPSDAQYRVTRNFVVEAIEGNPEDLINKTVFQDQFGDIPKAFGTVTDVQKLVKNGKEYYTLMLDYDFDKDIIVTGSIFGDLKIHPKTIVVENISSNSTTIAVDSTIGFPTEGTLILNNDLNAQIISYNGKTVDQFLNCSGVTGSISAGTSISVNTFAYGGSENPDESNIKFRITGVLSDIDLPSGSKYYENGDIGRILYLGYNGKEIKDNNWVFNKSVKCDVSRFTDDGSFKYTIETYDNNGIYEGDSVQVEYINKSTGQRKTSIIPSQNVRIPNGSVPGKIFQIKTSGYEISEIFSVRKFLSKYKNFISDVLNVYKDINNETRYVTSSSLPYYGTNKNIVVEDYKITLNGTFSGEVLKIVNDGQNHGFITGDAIVYNPEDLNSTGNKFSIQPGVYFVKKESETEIRLSRSRSDINSKKYISIASTTVSNNTISLLRFSKEDNLPSTIDSQRLVRSLEDPINDGKVYDTYEGTTGILINGVEILNYKSEDYIYYGPLKSIEVISPGRDLDIINPPILEISDSGITSTAQGYCGVEGGLSRIDIIDSGFDYIDTPVVNITGGGGSGATAVVKMIDYDHFVDINSTNTNGRINIASDIVGFSTYHKFRDGESIIYNTNGNTPIGGLSTSAKYYANVIDDYRINLHKNLNDALSGINTISITSYGVGNHRFESTERKSKINSIIVENSGSGYKNKKISVSVSGINTASNTIKVYEHPFTSGETIYYYGGTQNISGLDTGSYIVTRIDSTSFKLSNVGLGTTSKNFYYNTNQFVNFKDKGNGPHIFGYEPIQVSVVGKVGISTISNVDVSAKIQPVFRGKLSSIFLYDGGVGYGSSEIINYNRQPNFNLNAGTGARVTPVVSSGKIVSVIVNESGRNYNSPPNLIVRGFGVGAVLTPIISNGRLVEVKVVNGGINYQQKNTVIEVIVPLSGYELKSYPQVWTVNKFKRLLESSKIADDDGVVYKGKNKNYGLQYTHLYSPRSLRKKIYSQKIEEGVANYKNDYQNDFDTEKYHSPILGWSYDGHPIYGPYGYDSPKNKTVRQILSGYDDPIDNQPNRPNKKIFPAGYFIEDYEYNNSGDLDEHNGRFCITPEFPNGTYAYFMTLSSNISDSGVFASDKIPKYPYIIGNTYKSKPIQFNFNLESNQEEFNFNSGSIVRNTYKYNNLSDNSEYEYVLDRRDVLSQNSRIKSSSKGSIDSVNLISGGENYKVGDRVIFDNTNSGGIGAAAKVKYLEGRSITGISKTETTVYDVEFYPSSIPNRVIGFSSIPHNLLNSELINVDSLNDYDLSLQDNFNVEVRPDNFILDLGVGNTSVTGIVTYFYVSGLIEFPRIRENDILTIGSEDIKILEVDSKSSRIRVLREQNSTVSSAHSTYTVLEENPRKFFINLSLDLKNKDYNLNREIYFNPKESLGIGTIVGIGHTLIFSNPGIGLTSIIIPEKSIYIKNHRLETGNELLYKSNSGNPISVSTGIGSFYLQDNSIVYAAKISNDLIGISTDKVGLGTNGDFVGISQTSSTLYFIGIGTGGEYHSFTTRFNNVSKGNVSKNTVTVSTSTTHYLQSGDSVFLESYPGISTSIKISYSDYHRVLIADSKSFSSIDINENLINIQNHNYENGQKLIHTSLSPASGLEDQKIYYAIVYDQNRIKLSDSYYGATATPRQVVNITSSSSGTLSKVNPKIDVLRNNQIVFDLSDSSLSQTFSGIGRTESFNLEFYTDKNFSNSYFPVNQDGTSKIVKFGNIGIDSTAKIYFTIDDEFPSEIYYKLSPKTNLLVKNEIIVDTEVNEYNKIKFNESSLNKEQKITGITSNTFSFQTEKISESLQYLQNDGDFSYYTNSENEKGTIKEVEITSGGKSYSRLPFISTVTSSTGSDAIILPQSSTIGKIQTIKIEDIGYNYPIDPTLRPLIKFSSIIRVEPLSTFESIKVISPGQNYNTDPDLIIIDGFTDTVIEDVILNFDFGKSFVDIIQNTKGLYNATPRIVSINNSNGLGISSVSYNNSNKNVTVFFTKQFSDLSNFPFSVGDNVYIEGISILNPNDKGYNSDQYNYKPFPIVGINTGSIGGSGSYIEYSLSEFITGSEIPGIFDEENSSGRIISEDDLPVFEVKLTKNSFIIGENATSINNNTGKILKWDEKNEYLTVETTDDYIVGELIIGENSKSQAFIREIFEYETFYEVRSSSIVESGWNRKTGFLNDSTQVIQDSDYYQYFSYSLESEISIEDWDTVVSNLNHTLGFKKFSNLILNSNPNESGISTSQNEGFFSSVCDLNSIVDVECIQDFDLVSENSFYVNETLTSDEIIFNSVVLQDYSESVGNRVLIIDDISEDFNTSLSRTFVTSFTI
jgi:hypothetical protein